MAEIKDGGPAFPIQAPSIPAMIDKMKFGMSLRDWFAGQALCGLLLADEKARQEMIGDRRYSTPQEFAEAAVRLADALLTAREKRGEGKI